jgi:CheY-like chemotaxis protein
MISIFRKKKTWPKIELSEIKKRARLLVVDDSDFPYQSLFERDGYTIEKWPDVTDLPKLESGFYDVILLDLQGVGREHSVEQGLGILRHLRHSTPTQLIIAYSSADWSLKYQEFFDLADAVLAKSADYVDFKQTVDKLLQQRFSLGFYVSRVKALVGASVNEPDQIESLVRGAVLDQSPGKLQKYLEGNNIDPQDISRVLDVIKIGISIISLWKH